MGWRHPCGMTIFYVGGRIPYPPPRFRRASGSRISLMLVVPEFSAPTSGSSFFQLYQKRNLRSNQAVLPGPFCGSRQKKAGYFSSTAAPASSSLALAALAFFSLSRGAGPASRAGLAQPAWPAWLASLADLNTRTPYRGVGIGGRGSPPEEISKEIEQIWNYQKCSNMFRTKSGIWQ